MNRRDFLALTAAATLAVPLRGLAQQVQAKRIAVLDPGARDDPANVARHEALHNELEKLGWAEGRNAGFDERWLAGQTSPSNVAAVARSLQSAKPDVLVSAGSAATAAALIAAGTTPIVFVNVLDPIGQGFVASLGHPGGNATGTIAYDAPIIGKWLDILRQIAPSIARVALVTTADAAGGFLLRWVEAARGSLPLPLLAMPVSTVEEVDRGLQSLAAMPNSAVIIPSSGGFFQASRDAIVAMANSYRLPAMFSQSEYAVAGGLVSYGAEPADVWGAGAGPIDQILRGARPPDIPVVEPTKFRLVINARTAKDLRIAVPASVHAIADQVIE